MEEKIIFGIISVIIAGISIFLIRIIFSNKLKSLTGAQKLLGLITLGIIIIELAYLGLNFNLFKIASEIIASLGVAFALIVWALQNNLKNTVAGIGIYLNPEIEIGDIIEVDEYKGVIIELHLTKLIAMTEEGERLYIPTQKIHDTVVKIHHKDRRKKTDKEKN